MHLPRALRLTVVRHVPWLAAFLALGRFLLEQRQEQVAVLVRPQWIGDGYPAGDSSVRGTFEGGSLGGLPAKDP
jgi:hypothetical protein